MLIVVQESFVRLKVIEPIWGNVINNMIVIYHSTYLFMG
jgi:hypothetical protein